ncbi:hypothetical protein V8E54_001611 [Elaphomyces granulatus]
MATSSASPHYARMEMKLVPSPRGSPLLFDCERLTACNWGKRRFQALIQRRRWSCNAASSKDIDPDQAQAVSCGELERDGSWSAFSKGNAV